MLLPSTLTQGASQPSLAGSRGILDTSLDTMLLPAHGVLSVEGRVPILPASLGTFIEEVSLSLSAQEARISPKAGTVLSTVIPEPEANRVTDSSKFLCRYTNRQQPSKPHQPCWALSSPPHTHTLQPPNLRKQTRGSRVKGRAVVYLLCQSAISQSKSRATLPKGWALALVPPHP